MAIIFENVRFLNEGLFGNKITYEVDKYEKSKTPIVAFTSIDQKTAALNCIIDKCKCKNGKFILNSSAANNTTYYMYKYSSKSNKKYKYNKDGTIKTPVEQYESRKIESFELLKTFNSLEEVAEFAGVKIVFIDDKKERKEIIKKVKEIISNTDIEGVKAVSIDKSFIDGEDQETCIASIELDPNDDKKSDEVCKMINNLCRRIQSEIKDIKCEAEYDKYEGGIYIEIK